MLLKGKAMSLLVESFGMSRNIGYANIRFVYANNRLFDPAEGIFALLRLYILAQSRNTGQGFTFHPFQKRAASGRDKGEILRHASLIKGGYCIAATRH